MWCKGMFVVGYKVSEMSNRSVALVLALSLSLSLSLSLFHGQTVRFLLADGSSSASSIFLLCKYLPDFQPPPVRYNSPDETH